MLGPVSLIVRFNDGKENRYHVDHVKAWIQGGEREPGYFQQTELDSLPAIVATSGGQANVPLAPAPPIADIDQGPEPVVEAAPPVEGLEAVHPPIRRSNRPHRPPERYGL